MIAIDWIQVWHHTFDADLQIFINQRLQYALMIVTMITVMFIFKAALRIQTKIWYVWMANNHSVTCIEWQKYTRYHLVDDLFSLQPKTKLNISL